MAKLNITQLIEAQPGKNKWIKFDHMNVYLRIQRKLFLGRSVIQCITVAAVGMPERYQRRGRFTSLLAKLRSESQLSIYVENVHNRAFCQALLRREFIPAEYMLDEVLSVVELRGRDADLIQRLQAEDERVATTQITHTYACPGEGGTAQ